MDANSLKAFGVASQFGIMYPVNLCRGLDKIPGTKRPGKIGEITRDMQSEVGEILSWVDLQFYDQLSIAGITKDALDIPDQRNVEAIGSPS